MQHENKNPPSAPNGGRGVPRNPGRLEHASAKKSVIPRKPSPVPIYITGALFLILSSNWRLAALRDFVWLAVTCGATYFVSTKIFRGRKLTQLEIEELKAKQELKAARQQAKLDAKTKKQLKAPPVEPAASGTGDPELDALLAEGNLAISEMGKIRRACENRDVEIKILRIEEVSQKILDNAVDDRRDIPRTRKFLTYYLPTTIKLLHAYDRMAEQNVDGENISTTVKRIEDMLDDIIVAYNRQFDAMFSDEALDIETDIRVLEATMKREGLK